MSEILKTEVEISQTIIELYEGFYRNLSGNKKYKFNVTEKRLNQIIKFATVMNSQINLVTISVVKQYLTFAFGKYSGRKGFYGGKNQFTMGWIISVKLLKDFIKSKGTQKWVNEKRLTNENKIKSIIKTKTQKKKDFAQKRNMLLTTSNFEEVEKQKFLNTQKGFYWCVDFTTLYNPISDNCKKCKFNERCENLLKQNYPNVYKTRIEYE